MGTPRSFSFSTIATEVQSAEVRGKVIIGCPMGRLQHSLGFRGRCHVIGQSHAERRISSVLYNWERGAIILTLSTRSSIFRSSLSNSGAVLLEEFESFRYLGSSFAATGQAKYEISGRIGLARSAFTRLKSALWSRPKVAYMRP